MTVAIAPMKKLPALVLLSGLGCDIGVGGRHLLDRLDGANCGNTGKRNRDHHSS